MKIVTHCEDCIFAKLNKENKQESCSLDRPNKLGIEKLEGDYFELRRYCNAFRPLEWVQQLEFEESLNPENAVLQEVYPRIGFFVKLNTNEPNAIDALDLTINSITKIHGKQASYVVVINDKVEYNEEIWGLFIKYFGEQSPVTKYHIVQIEEKPNKIIQIIDEAFGKAENSWIMCTSSGLRVKPETLDRLHEILNIEMKQITMIEPIDDFNGLMFPAYLFKFLNGNKTKVFSDEIADSNEFIEKVRNAEERGQTKTIFNWREFYGK
jgi:hypothetical protein